jgi:hypothetical protein
MNVKYLFYSLLIADFLLAGFLFSVMVKAEPAQVKSVSEIFRTEKFRVERPPLPERAFVPVTSIEPEPVEERPETYVYHPIRWWDKGYRAVQADPVNLNEYVVGDYGCEQFAWDLMTNLREMGIYAYRVVIKFNGTDYGHIFVAIPTTDRGVVYIEPQDDFELEPPRVGDMFCYLQASWPGACNPSKIITKVVEYP